MDTAIQGYFRWLIRHRIWVLALAVVIVGLAAVRASRVGIDYTIEQFFPGWGPERERYEQYKLSFPKEDTQISLFWKDSRPPGVALYRDMQRAARLFEEVGLQDVQWFGSTLIEESSPSDSHIREALASHREADLYRGFLWNADQTVFAIHGALEQQVMDDDVRRREVEETLAERLSSFEREGTTLVLGGVPVVRSQIPRMLDEDQRLLVSAGLIVFLAILFLFFRHIGQIVLCLVSVVPAYFCTVALIGMAGKSVTVLTGFIPIIVLVVGGSDIIHLLSRYRQVRVDTNDNATAVVDAFSELATPCFYTSLTTAIGFLSLAGTRIGMIIDFGVFTAIAIFLTFAFSMTLLPVLLSFYRRETFNDRGLAMGWLRRVVEAAVATSGRPSGRAAAVFFAVAVIAFGLGTTLRVDAYLVDDLKEKTPLMRDLRWIEDKGFGVFQVVLFLRQNGELPLHHPESLRWMEKFQEFVRGEPVVVNSFGLPDQMKELRKAVNGPALAGTLPATLLESSQLITLAELRDADFFEDLYRQQEGEAQVIVAVRDEGSAAMLPFLERIDRYVAANPPPGATAFSTGTVKLIQNYASQVLQNFGPSLAIAVFLIFGVMCFMFRSVKQGLIALIPNFFPLIVLLGVMKVAGFDLKPSTILVFSIAFGLAVDDTIHVLGRYRHAVRDGFGVDDGLAVTLRDTGPALIMTSLVVSAGFSLLMFSRFEVLYQVGLMTMVAALAAVAADLFVFPSIIAARDRRASPPATYAASARGDGTQVSI